MVSRIAVFSAFGAGRSSRQSKAPVGAGRRTRAASADARACARSDARRSSGVRSRQASGKTKRMQRLARRARTVLSLRREARGISQNGHVCRRRSRSSSRKTRVCGSSVRSHATSLQAKARGRDAHAARVATLRARLLRAHPRSRARCVLAELVRASAAAGNREAERRAERERNLAGRGPLSLQAAAAARHAQSPTAARCLRRARFLSHHTQRAAGVRDRGRAPTTANPR